MKLSRRSLLAATAGSLPFVISGRVPGAAQAATVEDLDRAASAPILQLDGIRNSVIIESMELLRNENEILVRVRSKDGAEGVIVSNSWWLMDTYPIFLNRIASFLVGKDARLIEKLLEDFLQLQLNYKMQGLALWVCVAAAEMAVLELLGRIAGKSIGELFGGVLRREVAVYRASGRRDNKPEEEIEYLRQLVAETGASAVKFRVGGLLGNINDSQPGRAEALIPMVRKALDRKSVV